MSTDGRGGKSDRGRREALLHTVEEKARRKEQARREGDRTLWFGLGTFGLVGWSVILPTVVGIAAGVWLDRRVEGRISWALTGLVTGVILGCVNAWYWIRRKSAEE